MRIRTSPGIRPSTWLMSLRTIARAPLNTKDLLDSRSLVRFTIHVRYTLGPMGRPMAGYPQQGGGNEPCSFAFLPDVPHGLCPMRGFASKVKIEPKIDCIKHKKGNKSCTKPTFEAKLPCVETRVEQRSVQRRLGEAEEDMTSSPIESCLCIGSMHLSGTHDAHYN
jgi:hypothetical protein